MNINLFTCIENKNKFELTGENNEILYPHLDDPNLL